MLFRLIRNGLLGLCLFSSSVLVAADIVVVVHPSNSIDSISKEDSAKIFLGKLKSFTNGKSAIPLDQQEGAKERTSFYSKVARKSDSQLKSYWSRLIFTGKGQPPRTVSNSDEVKAAITANPNMISYMSVNEVDSSVKVILQIP
ncbi:MAG: phosphate ABC transporter substrate-binding protein [Gammaproteobacteria bacterium]|nr:MAG: phosphate ABC transporter substrate-binding protein [Gammaproteobacteria bacterium]PCJ21989.1 MAG: phosphate ABC transporter substrate-binding protein [Gammaproteobacteria bacterium]